MALLAPGPEFFAHTKLRKIMNTMMIQSYGQKGSRGRSDVTVLAPGPEVFATTKLLLNTYDIQLRVIETVERMK